MDIGGVIVQPPGTRTKPQKGSKDAGNQAQWYCSGMIMRVSKPSPSHKRKGGLGRRNETIEAFLHWRNENTQGVLRLTCSAVNEMDQPYDHHRHPIPSGPVAASLLLCHIEQKQEHENENKQIQKTPVQDEMPYQGALRLALRPTGRRGEVKESLDLLVVPPLRNVDTYETKDAMHIAKLKWVLGLLRP